MNTIIAALLLFSEVGHDAGQVQIPLDQYQTLIQSAAGTPRPSLVGYALGKAEVSVRIEENAGRATGEVEVALTVEVFENKWVLVPILPGGVSVASATA